MNLESCDEYKFLYKGVYLYFDGGIFGVNNNVMMWSLDIYNAEPSKIDNEFIDDLKYLINGLNNVSICIDSQLGSKIHKILTEKGFEHWLDEDETDDSDWWWPRDINIL